MLLGVLAFIGCVLATAAAGMSSSLVLMKMVDEVNVHLPASERLSPLGWDAWKYARLLREYRRLCPAGRSLGRLRYLTSLGILGTAGTGLVLGLPIPLVSGWAAVGCVATWVWHRSPRVA
jgi:hypothetical protein